VDVSVPKSAATREYVLKVAANFDGAFTEIARASIGAGYLDPHVDASKLAATNNAQTHVRLVFDPATFPASGITDTAPFWMLFMPVDFGGASGSNGAPSLVLPDSSRHGATAVTISGLAPAGGTFSAAKRLDLPFRAQNIRIVNTDSTDTLYVATGEGGPESLVGAGKELFLMGGATPSLWVRGNAGDAAFSATFVVATGTNL
jgi:hypothetical protein